MRGRLRTLFILGTRPEAIKLAPVILSMRKDPRFHPVVCITGQHREMLQPVLSLFRIHPRHDLDVMESGQSLGEALSATLARLDGVVREEKPELTIVQGDTTSSLAGSLSAFHHRVPVAHVEAGLRTHDRRNPFPEEIYRAMTSRVADFHFAPTAGARHNLLAEGIPAGTIVVTGNTGVDALLHVRNTIATSAGKRDMLRKRYPFASGKRPLVLVTGHRRENFGEGFRRICHAIRRFAIGHPEVELVFPVHLNPNVDVPARKILPGLPNVHLLEPLPYLDFVYLMMTATVILTDSGGIQEEAPTLKKPVLVTRGATERTEALTSGTALLVGSDGDRIVSSIERILSDPHFRGKMVARRNPFGDGKASSRILRAIGRWYSL